MAINKTYTAVITCDVCGAKETVNEHEPQSFKTETCATRAWGYIDERGKLSISDDPKLTLTELDLCPTCRERARSAIVMATSMVYHPNPSYAFHV